MVRPYQPPTTRAERRAIAKEAAKELLRTGKTFPLPPSQSPRLDAGWYLAAFMALVLWLLAPKIGRTLTVFVLIAMGACLVRPIGQLPWVRTAETVSKKLLLWGSLLAAAFIGIGLFGIYVWPHLPYYRSLSSKEMALFNGSLGKAPTGAEKIRLGCPQANEELCVVAGQFLPLFQRAGWSVEGNAVQRLVLPKPLSGVALFEHGEGTADPANPDQGLWMSQTKTVVQIVKAFGVVDMPPTSAADATMPVGTLGIYFGPPPEGKP
jgi:hypothetical protein